MWFEHPFLFSEEREVKAHQTLIDAFLNNFSDNPPMPPPFQGRGIVICGGGVRYFTCAWVCISILRQLGCTLPIQIWHLGPSELTVEMADLARSLGAETVDAESLRKTIPARILQGWELKPYAILNCPFREVLLLDADNICVRNPEYLFSEDEYRKTGATFWPDLTSLDSNRKIWTICRINYQEEPEFESGQVLIDKERCWKALKLTMHLNEHSDFFYRYILGDKETFHMAWRILNQPYSMPQTPIRLLDRTLCQHDFSGHRIFQHRNFAKWSLCGTNPHIEDFWLEPDCFRHLELLRCLWSNSLRHLPRLDTDTDAESQLSKVTWNYNRVGYDVREMRFDIIGYISKGASPNELFWHVASTCLGPILSIASENEITCRLRLDNDGTWRGVWLVNERMLVELSPTRSVI